MGILDSALVSMSRCHWLTAIAFELAISFGALAQEVSPIQVEGTSKDHLFLGDSPAQWLMAGTGFLALLISAWAVFLLWRTLKATREAVRAADDAVTVTRKLGEAQIRAYLHCRSATYKLGNDSVAAIVELENKGQSPASNVTIRGTTTIHEVGGTASHSRVLAYLGSSASEIGCQPINSGGSIMEEIPFFWEFDFPIEPDDDAKFKKRIFQEGNEIWFDLIVEWDDVFEKRQEMLIMLSAEIDATPHNPKKKRSKSGGLEFRVDIARDREGDEDTQRDVE